MRNTFLSGKIALVTGGAKGYGRGIANQLQAAGAHVTITGRDKKALAAAAAEMGVSALQADAASAKDWERVMAHMAKTHGGLDILVNNAGGVIKVAPVGEQTPETIAECIALNLTGPILGSRAALPLMEGRKGCTIVNISSLCDRESWPGWAVYAGAKAGLKQFSEGLYVDVRSLGIRVTTITPAWGRTEFRSAANLEEFDESTASRVTQPDEMGRVVAEACALPDHLCTLDLTLLPMVQEIVPL